MEERSGSVSGQTQRARGPRQVAGEAKNSKTGHLDCTVAITGDHLSEEHRFSFGIDQSYLPGLLAQLGAVLREYPIQDEQRG
jgi:hypothetical protein